MKVIQELLHCCTVEGRGGAARNGMHQLMDNVPIDGNYVGSIVRSACTCLSKLHGT